MENNIIFKIVSLVLIISMVLNLIPQNVYAEIIPQEIKEQSVSAEDEKTNGENIVKEIVDKREENKKYFLLENNDVKIAIYDSPVHYLKDGKWEDINNSLSESKDDDGDNVNTNISNNFKIKFAKTSKENKLVNIESDKFNIKWSLQNPNKVKSIKTSTSSNLNSESSNKSDLKNIKSSITYNNILNNIDISYYVESQSVKENIVLKNKEALSNKLIFNLDIGDCEAKLDDNGDISIYNKDEIVSKIYAPFMYDSNFEYSDKIKVKLEKNNNKYTLELEPDLEWLNDSNRAYPVTIDPTVNTSLYYQDIEDTYIYQGDSDNPNKFEAHILRVGGGISRIYRSLIKFKLPKINSGDQIINANLNLYNYPDTEEWNPCSWQRQINVHKVTSNWDQTNAYWSNCSSIYDPNIVDYSVYQYDSNNTKAQNFWNITSIVKDWYITGNNYGLMLKENNEMVTGGNEAYYLSANTNAQYYLNYRPVVNITYRNQTGLEDYLSYHQQSIGRAGTSYINDYNGNLILSHSDAQTPGQLMPATVTHIYNTNDKDLNINYGNGWRLNISQLINIENIDGKEYAKYIDEDGTAHYFLKQGSTNIYKDEDGLSLTLTLNSDSTFTLKDKGNNTITFEKRIVNGKELWHLNKISDASGNSIKVTFLQGYPNNFYIDTIVDGAGSTLKLYWINGKLGSIVDQNSKAITYQYDNNSRLVKIIYPDEKSSIYVYDGKGLLTSAKNIDGSHVDYKYNVGLPYRVSNITEYSSSNEVGNSLDMSYGKNSTTFTDSNGYSNLYSFNNFGNLISAVDFGKSSTDISKAYGKTYKYGNSNGEKNKITLDSKMISPVINKILNGNAELDSNWTYINWGANTGSLSYQTNQKYYGNRSLNILSNNNNKDSRVFAYQSMSLEKGKTYTLSSYIKTQSISNINNGGAQIFVYYNTPSGLKLYGSTPINGTSDWNRNSCTFTYSSDAIDNVIVALGINVESGNAYFDGIQLEEGEVVNTYNLIENSGFDFGLTNWVRSSDCNATNDTVVSTIYGNNFRFTGEAASRKNIDQRVNISGKKGDIYSLSSWVKTGALPNDTIKLNRVTAGIARNDNSIQWIDIDINGDSNSWQYVADQFITDSDYKYIDIYLTYYYNSNEVYFDNVSLLKEDFGQSYSYDKDGNLISTQDLSKQNSTMQYNGNNEILNTVDAKGGKFVYEYDSKVRNRLLAATNNSKISYIFNYDNFGNTTSTLIENKDKISTELSTNKIYYIRTKSSGLYFDVSGNSNSNGTSIVQYLLNSGQNQKWKIYDTGDNYYYIRPQNASNMNLQYSSDNKIQIANPNSSDSQKWKIQKNIDGSFKIFSKEQNQENVITIPDNSKNIGINLIKSKDENNENQSFFFEEVGVDNSEDKSILESGEVFYIKSKNSNLYLDYGKDSNGNITDGNFAKIVQRKFSGDNSQKWRIVRKENGEYKIISLNSKTGRAIDLKDSKNSNNNPVQMYDYSEAASNQEWTVYKNDNNTYRITSKSTNDTKDLAVKDSSNAEESEIVVYDTNYQNNQKWYLEPVNMLNIEEDAIYNIKNKNSNLYLGLTDGLDNNGVSIEQSNKNADLNQEWKFVKLSNGYFKIVNKNNNKVMNVKDSSTQNSTKIQLWDDTNSISQQYEIVPLENGLVNIKPRIIYGKSSINITGSSKDPGANLEIYDSSDSLSMQFYLEKVNGPTNLHIESKAEYTNDGRFLNKIIDSTGKEVTYNYNFNEENDTGSGTLSNVVDAKGNKTQYGYDNLDRLTKVSLTDGDKTYSNTYTYLNDRLSSILHNGFSYGFIYDNFGNTKQVKVNDQVLVTNNYESRNGNLKSSIYGNNQTVSYTYDRFNRVSSKIGTNGTNTYQYDSKGNLAVKNDGLNKLNHKYTYDLSDRLVNVSVSNGFEISYNYDSNSNVTKLTSSINSKNKNIVEYSIDSDNKQTSVKLNNNINTIYNYDRLSRLQEKYIKSGSNSYKTSIEYISNPDNQLKTTTMVSSIKNGQNDKISYTYDANGNIESIFYGNELSKKYYYDGLNQLIREDNKELNETILYSYDKGGNILNKKIYDYTLDADLTGKEKKSENNYEYDLNWKDKLVSYNGKNITYDNIGNPLTYDGKTYVWQNGRQLSAIMDTEKVSSELNEPFEASKLSNYILTGDYNGDGKDDIAGFYDCGNLQIKVIVWMSDGSKYSNGKIWFDSGIGNFDLSKMLGRIVSGDYNGDGKDDIAVLYDYGSALTKVLVWTSAGNTFNNQKVWWDSGVGNFEASKTTGRVVSGDYNGDGKDDIAFIYDYGNATANTYVWLSTGTNYLPKQAWYVSGAGNFEASRTTGRVVSGDYNGDGKDDIAFIYDYGNTTANTYVWLSTGTNYLQKQAWYVSGAGNFEASRTTGRVVSGDYNGDGKDDIAFIYDYGNATANTYIWLSTGTNYLQKQAWYVSGPGNFEASIATGRVVSGDYNGDGKDDIATLYSYDRYDSSYINFISKGNGFINNTFSNWWNSNSNSIFYNYNDNGIRTQKRVNEKTTDYYLDGDKVLYEKTGNNIIYYIYDAENNLLGFKYNETQYYYVRNAQGDIIQILDNNLKCVVSYTYDTWGVLVKITDGAGLDVTNDSNNIGNINPYRYRGYRYDNETQMYYLNSRYYNPEFGRFINADSYGGDIGKVLSHNSFAYCLNNPINQYDPNGNFAFVIPFLIPAVTFILSYIILSTPAVQQAITETVKAVGNVIDNTINNTIKNIKTAVNTSTKVTTVTTTATVKNKDNKNPQYWAADNAANKLETLTYVQAQVRVASGNNIICANQNAAYLIARIYSTNPLPEIDKNQKLGQTYYWHYHRGNNKHGSPHIWFYGEPN